MPLAGMHAAVRRPLLEASTLPPECYTSPAFYERETQFRRAMAYPPFTSLANVIVRDTNLEKAIRWSRQLSEYFSPHDGNLRILGPAAAPLAKLKREHRFQFLLKSPKRSLLAKILSGAMA